MLFVKIVLMNELTVSFSRVFPVNGTQVLATQRNDVVAELPPWRKNTDSSNLGFLAFAFISGYNVDKFLDKLEKIAGVTGGIGKPGGKKTERTRVAMHWSVIFLAFPSVNGRIYA